MSISASFDPASDGAGYDAVVVVEPRARPSRRPVALIIAAIGSLFVHPDGTTGVVPAASVVVGHTTLGFQCTKMPEGFSVQIHACSTYQLNAGFQM